MKLKLNFLTQPSFHGAGGIVMLKSYHLLLPLLPLSDGNMDDKSAVKAKGLWEDWHMRQLNEQASRINHRSGAAQTGRLLTPCSFTHSC